jgi:hypothetical protein
MSRFREWADRKKPAARVRTHLLAAALLWTIVGFGLAAVGLVWCFTLRPPWSFGLAVAGLAVGTLKGFYIIRRIARGNSARLIARGDGHCLGGFLSAKTWLLVLAMMASGILLRQSPIPRPVLGVIYAAVGTGLLIGSFPLWKAHREAALDSL